MSDGGNNSMSESLWFEFYHVCDSFCSSDSLSLEGLRDIFQRHGLTPNHNLDISKYDFFIAACENALVDEGIIQLLLEYFPEAVNATADKNYGFSSLYAACAPSLHFACSNENVTLGIIQLLIDASPDSTRSVDNYDQMALHHLCANKEIDDTVAIAIVKLLLEKCPESVRHADNFGCLPVHYAAMEKSPEFCRVLIGAYPGSERFSTDSGMLPLHCACMKNTLATVEYFYDLEPDAINIAETVGNGKYPIHLAIMSLFLTNVPEISLDVVQFLLDCNPNVKLQKIRGESLLAYACGLEYGIEYYDVEDLDMDFRAVSGMPIIEAIYDAHPEAIEDDMFASEIHNFHDYVQTFINGELVYARQARDHRLIRTPDENGRLPLHTALRNNVTLGSIKLLVKGNPSAIRCADMNCAFPLHLACQHHDSPSVVQYLVDLDVRTLETLDRDGNTALHYACRGAKYETIALLLEKYDAASVSKRNAQEKLPIDVLLENNAAEDRESVKYLGSIFLLLKAHPETVMNYM